MHASFFILLFKQCIFLGNYKPLSLFIIFICLALSFSIIYKAIKYKIRFDSYLKFISLYYFYIILDSYIHHANHINTWILEGIFIISFILAFKITIHKSSKLVALYIYKILSLFIFINFILVVFYPEGLWQIPAENEQGFVRRYLLGALVNMSGPIMLIAILSNAIFYKQTGKAKLNLIFLIICSIGTLYIIGSKTNIVGLCLLSLFFLLKKKDQRQLYIKLMLIFFFIYQFFILFSLSSLVSNHYVQYFIEEVLNKDLTFSGRSSIWVLTMFMISLSPIFGWGIQDVEWNFMHIEGTYPHNLILNFLYTGGIIALVIFILMFWTVYKKTFKFNSTYISQISQLSFWVFMIMNVTEAQSMFYFCIIFAYMYYNQNFLPDLNFKIKRNTK